MSLDIERHIADWFSAQPGFDAFELASVSVRRYGKRSFVEVFLDRQQGQITLDECGVWNRALSAHLEQADLFNGPYLVEISSPGIDRPLQKRKDFERVIGRTIKARYQEPEGAAREFLGKLLSAGETGIELQSKAETIQLPYTWILQARQEVTF